MIKAESMNKRMTCRDIQYLNLNTDTDGDK